MRIIEIDTDKFLGFKCPESQLTILFDPDDAVEGLSEPDEIIQRTSVLGLVIPEADGMLEAGK